MINKKLFTIISTLTISEMKGRYRNTWAGFLWVIINPILMFSVHALVFKHILKLNMDNYYVFLLGGLLPWLFINSTLTMTCNAFITNREVLLSFQINPLLILASKVIDNFINFISPFLLLLIVLAFRDGFALAGLISLPLSMLVIVIGTFALSLFFSVLQVYFRDTQFILNFGLSILYFLTPIFYPEEMVPAHLSWIVKINPVYALIHPFQIALSNYDFHNLVDASLKSIFFSINIIFVSAYFWRKKRNELYLYL